MQQQSLSKQTSKLKELQAQLLSMEFQKQLVEEALKITDEKDKAIQYIISMLQKEDQVMGKMQQKQEDYEDVEQQYKMIFLVRMDLKMGLGKMAAQVAHAALRAYKQIQQKSEHDQFSQVAFFQWCQSGSRKIVVKVSSEQQLMAVYNKALQKKINACYIRDAGLTQIAAGSVTVAAIGPASSSDIDPITKHLKLL